MDAQEIWLRDGNDLSLARGVSANPPADWMRVTKKCFPRSESTADFFTLIASGRRFVSLVTEPRVRFRFTLRPVALSQSLPEERPWARVPGRNEEQKQRATVANRRGHRPEETMKFRLAVAAATIAAIATPALAQQFYVVQDSSTKKCTIVEQRPTTSTMVVVGDGKVYTSRAEAEGAVKTITVCK
jgi:hypothetical protein